MRLDVAYRGSTFMTTEAERMTAHWTWWRVLWHRLKGHEITHPVPYYPQPVCRTCELERLHDSQEGSK